MSLPFKMVCVDLDGTLLQPDHTVSDVTRDVLQKISALGVHVVIATGRPYTDVRFVEKTIGLNDISGVYGRSGGCYLITSNGARVYDAFGNLIIRKNIPEVLCRRLYSLAKDDTEININIFRDVTKKEPLLNDNIKSNEMSNLIIKENEELLKNERTVKLQCEEEWVCRRPADEEAKLYEKSNFRYRVENELEVNYPTDNVSEIFFLCYNVQKALELEQNIENLANDYVRNLKEENKEIDAESAGILVAPSAPHCLDIVPKSTSKGAALKAVAALLGLTMDDVIAFGDGMNDLSMLSIVKKGCIMLNAHPRVKEALPNLEVIASNVEHGVAKKLQEVFTLP